MIIVKILLPLLLIFTLISSIKLSLKGLYQFPDSKLINFISSELWCLSLFLFLPWLMGEFARGETSPFPWMVLLEETEQHGVFNGLIYATMVIFVDLWLFWIPAHLWITNRKENDRTKRIMARLLNFFAGLLLSTAWNPIYRLLALFMEAPY